MRLAQPREAHLRALAAALGKYEPLHDQRNAERIVGAHCTPHVAIGFAVHAAAKPVRRAGERELLVLALCIALDLTLKGRGQPKTRSRRYRRWRRGGSHARVGKREVVGRVSGRHRDEPAVGPMSGYVPKQLDRVRVWHFDR